MQKREIVLIFTTDSYLNKIRWVDKSPNLCFSQQMIWPIVSIFRSSCGRVGGWDGTLRNWPSNLVASLGCVGSSKEGIQTLNLVVCCWATLKEVSFVNRKILLLYQRDNILLSLVSLYIVLLYYYYSMKWVILPNHTNWYCNELSSLSFLFLQKSRKVYKKLAYGKKI